MQAVTPYEPITSVECRSLYYGKETISYNAFLEELATTLRQGHEASPIYKYFSVEVIDSDSVDLVEECGASRRSLIGADSEEYLIDFGGVPNMDNPERHGVYFNLEEILKHTTTTTKPPPVGNSAKTPASSASINAPPLSSSACMCIGAFAAAKCFVGCNSEGIMNWNLSLQPVPDHCESVEESISKSNNQTKFTQIVQNGLAPRVANQIPLESGGKLEISSENSSAPYKTAPYTTPTLGCLGNLFVSSTTSATKGPLLRKKVLRIEAKERLTGIKSASIPSGMSIHSMSSYLREILSAHYRPEDLVVGMGGVIKVLKGWIQGHVMPEFLNEKIVSPQQGANWLRFFANGPGDLTLFSTFLTDAGISPESKSDWENLHPRVEHTHFYGTGENGNQGGHYHGDLQFTTEENEALTNFRNFLPENQKSRAQEPIHYIGYFAPAKRFYRVNDPAKVVGTARL